MCSFQNLYKISDTLFNPGPYSCFVAVGVPLAIGYSLNKALPQWERFLGMATLVVSVQVLSATLSRASLIAAIVGCLFEINDIKKAKDVAEILLKKPLKKYNQLAILEMPTRVKEW